mmetsp:Transcript_12062/g.24466  ORF Transcript_12062/g.24466 Transcript_12062/m.24466 type:complete len:211 (-) Transcript_12062:1175-1807(-)
MQKCWFSRRLRWFERVFHDRRGRRHVAIISNRHGSKTGADILQPPVHCTRYAVSVVGGIAHDGTKRRADIVQFDRTDTHHGQRRTASFQTIIHRLRRRFVVMMSVLLMLFIAAVTLLTGARHGPKTKRARFHLVTTSTITVLLLFHTRQCLNRPNTHHRKRRISCLQTVIDRQGHFFFMPFINSGWVMLMLLVLQLLMSKLLFFTNNILF